MEYLHIDRLKIDFTGVTRDSCLGVRTRFTSCRVGGEREGGDHRHSRAGSASGEPELARMISRDIQRA